MLFKIVTHYIDTYNHWSSLISNPDIHHTRGHSERFMIPMSHIVHIKLILTNALYAIKIWNSLSERMIG